MTVYLAYHGYDYDGDTVIGVFDNLDAAVACCRNVYNGTWTKGQTWNGDEALTRAEIVANITEREMREEEA
jgi:hypothetical protein